MKERPILFSAPMVRAVLEGRKTQTRRLVKPQPPTPEAVRKLAGDDYHWMAPQQHTQHAVHRPVGPVWAVRDLMGSEPGLRSPYGVPGDRLWVKETWAVDEAYDDLTVQQIGAMRTIENCALSVWYRADGDAGERGEGGGGRWRPSIHCFRWASRITLRVTSVRVERLQAITEDDAIAEGLEPDKFWEPNLSARQEFAALWNTINEERAPYQSNPWVWVVGFEREGAA